MFVYLSSTSHHGRRRRRHFPPLRLTVVSPRASSKLPLRCSVPTRCAAPHAHEDEVSLCVDGAAVCSVLTLLSSVPSRCPSRKPPDGVLHVRSAFQPVQTDVLFERRRLCSRDRRRKDSAGVICARTLCVVTPLLLSMQADGIRTARGQSSRSSSLLRRADVVHSQDVVCPRPARISARRWSCVRPKRRRA